jgi:CheY-like chemotaxis protein
MFVARPLGKPAPRPVRVLVVDDCSLTLDWTADILEDAGYEVARANGALAALRSITRVQPDIALLDVAMPTMRGDQLAQLLAGPRAVARIILCSYLDRLTLADMARRIHAHGYLAKTADPQAFLAAFRDLVDDLEVE